MKHEILYQGKYLRLLRRRTWEFVQRSHCTGIVIILAMTDDGKVIFVEQYREPVRARVIEFPAGLVNDHYARGHGGEENIETAALRELFEETGYSARRLEHLVTGPVSAGLSSDSISFYRAFGLKKEGAGGGDADECITVHAVPFKGVENWLKRKQKEGCLVDPKAYAGLYFLEPPQKRTAKRPPASRRK